MAKPALTLNLSGSTIGGSQAGTSLFGSSSNAQGGGLFGGSTASKPQQQSLFGSTATQQPASSAFTLSSSTNMATQGGSSLFGAPAQQQPKLGGSLFGASTQQPATQTGGLFGNTSQNTTQQTTGGLFGNTLQQPQQQSGGLFGSTQPQQQQGSLFGSTLGQPQQTGSLFGSSNTQQQQQQPAAQGSLFGTLNSSQTQPQGLGSSIWQGAAPQPRTKSIPEQMQTLAQKWLPESPLCLMQHYFYNAVNPDVVPYFGPAPGEDEKKWEEALSKKPSAGSVPVLARGFKAIGDRLEIQTMAVSQLQMRMHEINNALTKMMQDHELSITVRIADSRRRHTTLSLRCSQLATKVQVLRNRGYALDGAEETLKQKLVELEKIAYDPVLSGRQEEIWARLSGLRERALFLQEETERLGKTTNSNDNDALDEGTARAIQKLLADYDSQLNHLQAELVSIKADLDGWEGDSPPAVKTK